MKNNSFIIVLLVLALIAGVLTSCAADTDAESHSSVEVPDSSSSDKSIFEMGSYEMIEYETGIYDSKNWNDPTGTYYGDVVPSKTVALNIAVSVFEGMEKSKTASQFTPQRVFYDEEEGIWIVTFWDSDAYENGIMGYDCTIAIDKRNGAVVRIWFGE